MDFFKKTHHYAAYKRLTSDIRTYTVYIVIEKIRYLMQMETKRKLYLHKTMVFKTKIVIRDKEGHCIMMQRSIHIMM